MSISSATPPLIHKMWIKVMFFLLNPFLNDVEEKLKDSVPPT